MQRHNQITGHIMALITVFIWGATFVASDFLLDHYTSAQVLLLRFMLGYLMLWVIKPKFWKPDSLRTELEILMLSVFGVLVYYLLETKSIEYGGATVSSILISTAPMWTLVGLCMTGSLALRLHHFLGFLLAIGGVVLVIFNGAAITFSASVATLLYCVGSCICWVIYTLLLCRLADLDSIFLTRRMLFYTLIIMLPIMAFQGQIPSFSYLAEPENWISLGILGILGSGFCYIWWKNAVAQIGAVITTNYIYLIPFITILVAVLLGRDVFSLSAVIGTVLILVGILISNRDAA